MKVYVTKFALTKGIQEKEVSNTRKENTVVESVPTHKLGKIYYKPFWHLTRQEAIKHANELRDKKMSSLLRQLNKLSNMKF